MLITTLSLVLGLMACGDKGDDTGTTPDGGAHDGGAGDGGGSDGGGSDGGSSDGGSTVTVSAFCESISPDPATVTDFYEDNPTYTDEADDILPTATPDEMGMDGRMLDAAAEKLGGIPVTWSFLVLRHGSVVAEHYFNGSDSTASNNVHSASKSILGALTGIAIDEGVLSGLDQPVAELLPDLFEGLSADKQAISVEQLLTMTSGLRWVEDETEYDMQKSDDWLAAYLAQPLDHAPGTYFEYSTGSTHLLGAALSSAAGVSYCDYAHDHLLSSLSIEAEHWGRDPQGWFSAGFNVYLTPRELARFGQAMLDGGVWDGTQVVPADWVDASFQHHQDAGMEYGYGYLWWLWEPLEMTIPIAWGYGGQLVYVVPDYDIVMVVTTNTADYDPSDFDAGDILMGFVIDAVYK